MKIGELAKAAECTTETVRFYEKEGLLPAAVRTGSNYRHYDASHVERLRFIRNCRSLDMTLDEVRELLEAIRTPDTGCEAVNRLLDEHIGHVRTRLAELRRLERQLRTLREQCQSARALADCGILQGLAALDIGGKRKRQTHL